MQLLSVRPMITLLVILLVAISPHKAAKSQPLHTNSRWIVNESRERVKLSCVNWVTHLEAVVAEGLSKQPVDVISQTILHLGFNCVRLTWPLFLITNDSLASISVRQSFLNLGLDKSIGGFQANNPSILDLSLIDAFQAVVASLAKHNVMIILDNHLSKPGWCCGYTDGNGFFGDPLFDPDLWISGLSKMATMFNGTKNVVGMSLRNELRGPKTNVNDWYRYMQNGAEAVHAANPDVLVILSGLNYERDLSFLLEQPANLSFTGKLVYELHWYGFTDGQAWETGNPNQVCGRVVNTTMASSGFLLDQGYPLFVSEFGMDERGINVNDNRYFNCFLGWAAELDLDWALWTLTGSYYLREGMVEVDEVYGIYNPNWCELRNSSFLQRISLLQTPLQGPGGPGYSLHKLIFHPSTGLCLQRNEEFSPLALGPCSKAEEWSYGPENVLTTNSSHFCLQADSLGQPAKLGLVCTDESSKWEAISDSKMHLSSKLDDGSDVCLDVDDNNVVVTNTCKCLNDDSACDPASQWFKIIDSSRPITASKFIFRNQCKRVI